MTTPEPLRILLLGMRCRFTLPVAEALIADPAVEVAGVVVPAQGTAPASSLDRMLRQNNIPLREAPSLRKHETEPLLREQGLSGLEALVVACFPWRVPRWLRELPRLGALNVHPSLLPALRGPEPEFWALRLGMRETGVTVHLMDAGLDTGPIVRQRPVPVPPDVTLPALETALATVGGSLVCEALHGLAAGEIVPYEQAGVPSHAPVPGFYDLTVPTNLPAGWAAGFARAVLPVYRPLLVLVMTTGERLLVDEVIGVDEGMTLPAPVVEDGGTVAVRFVRGVVRFRRAGG